MIHDMYRKLAQLNAHVKSTSPSNVVIPAPFPAAEVAASELEKAAAAVESLYKQVDEKHSKLQEFTNSAINNIHSLLSAQQTKHKKAVIIFSILICIQSAVIAILLRR